jgi:hypothetical protein
MSRGPWIGEVLWQIICLSASSSGLSLDFGPFDLIRIVSLLHWTTKIWMFNLIVVDVKGSSWEMSCQQGLSSKESMSDMEVRMYWAVFSGSEKVGSKSSNGSCIPVLLSGFFSVAL